MGFILDEIKSYRHPEIEEGVRTLLYDCRPQLEKFCKSWGISIDNLSFDDKEDIFYHRISIKLDAIREAYTMVDAARKKYPEGFDSLFEELFSKKMATSIDCPLGKRDADDSAYRDLGGRIHADAFAGISIVYYTYPKAFVQSYYSVLYNDGEFSKYIFDSSPSFSNFRDHLSDIFSLKEIPTEVSHLSLDHIKLLQKNLYRLPAIHKKAVIQKKYDEEIQKNDTRKQFATQFLGYVGRPFNDYEYLISNISSLDAFISRELQEQCDTIKRYYPSGYDFYCRHNHIRDLSKIIAAKDEIRSYNQYGALVEPYDSWETRQKYFTTECKTSISRHCVDRLEQESNFNPGFERLLINGQIGKLDYNVCRSALYPVCINQFLDYTALPEVGVMSRRYASLRSGQSGPILGTNQSSAVNAFINHLCGKYRNRILIVIAPGDNPNDEIINRNEFRSLAARLKSERIATLNLSDEDESGSFLPSNDFSTYQYVLILDAIFKNASVEKILSVFQDIDDYHPSVFYMSLAFVVDEMTMRRKLENKKREIQEAQQRKLREQRLLEQKRIEEERIRKQWQIEQERKRKEQEEKDRLCSLSHTKKRDSDAIKTYLSIHGVQHLYHFTDRRNIESIKQKGGLFSWNYCENKGITINKPGGDAYSRSLDSSYGLEDYVRLSFCTDLPMKYRLEEEGYDLVLLRINPEVACLESTLFSDMNATDKLHNHGGTFDDLKMVDLTATKMRYVRRDSIYFKPHQAEVMVRTFIPLEYIENINDFS